MVLLLLLEHGSLDIDHVIVNCWKDLKEVLHSVPFYFSSMFPGSFLFQVMGTTHMTVCVSVVGHFRACGEIAVSGCLQWRVAVDGVRKLALSAVALHSTALLHVLSLSLTCPLSASVSVTGSCGLRWDEAEQHGAGVGWHEVPS
jgi:hypothetical protein